MSALVAGRCADKRSTSGTGDYTWGMIIAAVLGGQELLIILVIALLLFGSSQLPKLARSIGQAQKEFKKGVGDSDQAHTDRPDGTTNDS